MGRYQKVYVEMTLFVDLKGKTRPAVIHWADGGKYKVDRVVSERVAPPDHVGGVLTTRYELIVEGYPRILYLERNTGRWFLEKEIQ